LGKGFRMKKLILASVICLVPSYAQDKAPQLISPEKLFEFPLVHPNAPATQTFDLRGSFPKRAAMPPSSLELNFKVNQTAVCSVPLLEAHVDVVDPGIAVMPSNNAVPIPQAHVPAPACPKK
jgi:hypothetical protein